MPGQERSRIIWRGICGRNTTFRTEERIPRSAIGQRILRRVNEDWDTVFYLNDTAFVRSEPYSALLSELGINTAELADDGAYIIIRTAGHPAEIYREGARPLRTSLGILQFNGDEVLLNGEKCISAPEENADAGCHVTVLDAETGRLLDEAALDCCSNTVLRAATEK